MDAGSHTATTAPAARNFARRRRAALCALIVLLSLPATGCGTTLTQWVRSGFKVGPNYAPPPAAVEDQWIDFGRDPRIRADDVDTSTWWTVLGDARLNALVEAARQQNISLRTAGTRIQQAQALRGIAAGQLFPQAQQAVGGYSRNQVSREIANSAPRPYFDQWNAGFNLSWELDFWGRFRRGIESADAALEASIANYDDVMVLLVADVASTYVQYRTLQEELRLVRENVRVQTESLRIAEVDWKAGKADKADFLQTRNNVEQTAALEPALEAQLRQANNALCVLLGLPPRDLSEELGVAPIPRAAADVVVGVPADLLRRRPDVRRAERVVAAQCAQIGVAEAELYPHFQLNGTLQWQADAANRLFTGNSVAGFAGPGFTWNILNYGRLQNNVRQEQALYWQTVYQYEETVLQAQREAEDALIGFLKAHDQTRELQNAVNDIDELDRLLLTQARAGARNFDRVYVVQAQQTAQQDNLAVSQGNVALNLIRIYRALGGGWQTQSSAVANPWAENAETIPPGGAPALPPAGP